MPFVKGQSGNPAGRPKKGMTFSEIVHALPLKDRRELAKLALQRAIAGDEKWGNWFLRAAGEAIALQHTGQDGASISIEVIRGVLADAAKGVGEDAT